MVLVAMLLVVLAALAMAWLNRESIADNVIADELARRGIEATYTIEQIGPEKQVLRDVVVGNPDRPDLTIARAEVLIRHRLGFPRITEVRLIRPRLFAAWRDGALSLGALDPLLVSEEAVPFELPDLVLSVEDGRALLETDYGPVGIGLEGSGHLRGGFSGELAAIAPRLAINGCEAQATTLYGQVSVEARRPTFVGPLRLSQLSCPGAGVELASAALQLEARANRDVTSVEGRASVRSAGATLGANRVAALSGSTRFTWRDRGLTARYSLEGRGLATPQASIARLALDGWLRARRDFDRVELDTTFEGEGMRLGPQADSTLADAAEATSGTFLAPILQQIRGRLAEEARASRVNAELVVRRTGSRTSVVVPSAAWRGGSGASLLTLTRLQLAAGEEATPRFTGSFSTGGAGLPRIVGRLESFPGGRLSARMTMADYVAGDARMAIPELAILRDPAGTIVMTGEVRASGPLPGGLAEGLIVPLSGAWSPSNGLALWNTCTDLRFQRLELANLALDGGGLRLCPPARSAILRYDGRGPRLAASAPSLDASGRLGETPIAIRSGPIAIAYPGDLSAQRLVVSLGPQETATVFAIDDLNAQVGAAIGGRFAGADIRLFAVPLDMLGASGSWRYGGGRLTLDDGAFRLVDRQIPGRFEPLMAQGATLALENNVVLAEALMREPATGRRIVDVDVRHDLASGRGHADLSVPGIIFDERLQPASSACAAIANGAAVQRARATPWLTCLAFGVVSNVRGTVTGVGRIDWDEERVSSSGRFSSDSLDLAAAFGPVGGASGTIVFSDLLGLTTAPNQRIRVASINPGIEVTEGEVVIEIQRGEVLALRGGTWPFMGGTLTLRPIDINIGEAEARRYVLEIVGLEAAQFVERMGLSNIAATGTFDGTVPLVFDAEGNGRLEGGLLLSRPPGGNVSYVGELTYEDLTPIANFAFDALRSLDYRQMRIAMDGNLAGQIVTRVRFDGVSQGAGARQNLVTRAVAGLPMRFDVNIRAPFYSLFGSIRALYDPAAIRDPRELGLLDEQGNPLRRETDGVPPEEPAASPDESLIQRRESEETP